MTKRQVSWWIGSAWHRRPAGRTGRENIQGRYGVSTGLVAGVMAGLAAATAMSCRLVPVGIPMEETRVLSSEVHRAETPTDVELRVSFSGLSRDGHALLGTIRQVGRCKRWKTSRVQVVSTTAYRRRHLPPKAWGWVSTVAGVGLSALGVGLMAANVDGMKGTKDDMDADLQRRRFIGGIWSLLPGLGLAALGITWLALDSERTLVEKGPVRRIRQPRGLEDCQVRPLVQESFRVSPGDSGQWHEVVTDGRGRFRLDLLDMLIEMSSASVPTRFLFSRRIAAAHDKVMVGASKNNAATIPVRIRQGGQSVHVTLDDDLANRVAGLLRNDEITVVSGQNSWRVRLGGKKAAVVSRAVLNCDGHFDIHLVVTPGRDREGPDADSGTRPRSSGRAAGGSHAARARRGRLDSHPGSARRRALGEVLPVGRAVDGMGVVSPLKTGSEALLFCGPEAVARLRLAAPNGKAVVYGVRIDAKPNRPAGRVLRRQGRLLALDKGTAQRVLVGRRGVVLFGRRKVGGFSVVQVTRSNAAARLDEDLPAGIDVQRLTYRLVD